MEAAKSSIKKVLSKSGQHDTTIHETIAPAVQHETVTKQQHEREQVAVDREVHQDHHHTTEQPIAHRETLPEQHHHREIPVEHREFKHGNDEDTKRRVAEQAAQYRDTQTHAEGERTKSSEAAVSGEHVHHHVHETIQPVVHKQTVEPHVVHTTVPIHEVHQNEAKHHAASALPAISMDDFKKKGGSLGGREQVNDFFPGEPKKFDGDRNGGGLGLDGHGSNPKQSGIHGTESSVGGQSSMNSQGQNTLGSGAHTGTQGRDTSMGNTSSQGQAGKPSLMDKLNPSKDADGDGKAGFMK